MRLLKTLILLILLTMIFAQITYADNTTGEQNECSYSNIFSGIKAKDLIEIIAKYCDRWTGEPWVFEKLDINTGVYETVGVLHNAPKWYPEAVSFPANIAILDNDGPGLSFDVVSLSTMKVIGKITVDVSPGTDLVDTGAYIIISPDGSRIFVNWNDGPNDTLVTEVFDGNTYKKIIKYSSALIIGGFSNDGRYAYLINSVYSGIEWKISVLELSTMQITKVIQLPDSIKWYLIGNTLQEFGHQFDSNIAFHKKQVSYVYNINNGALSVSIPTRGDCDNSFLSPKATWLLCAGKSQVDAYNISTGNWAAVFTTTTEGAIISWANDHTFIYNTTQKLIYFDIKQNKIIKELPIIRPWEKKGWKPEVGK